jgi:hypothetical protein
MQKTYLKIIVSILASAFILSCTTNYDSEISKDNASSISRINAATSRLIGSTPNDSVIKKPVKDKDKTKSEILLLSGSNSNKNKFLLYDVKVYRIDYPTVDYAGNPITASGTLMVPQKINATDSFPVLSIQHGTAFGDFEVENSSFDGYVYQYACSGFITLVPDYIGYNTSKNIQHPYFINSCSDRALRDMITASLAYTKKELLVNNNGKLFLHGFSEGANVTISFLKSIESNPIPNLNVIATGACSGAYALGDQFSHFANNYFNGLPGYKSISATFLTYMILGYDRNIAKLNWDSFYLNSPYNNILPVAYDGRASKEACGEFTGNLMKDYPAVLSPYFITSLTNGTNVNFKKYLDDNSLIKNWCPNSKLTLYHGNQDYLVPMYHTDKLFENMRSRANFNGASIRKEIFNGDHVQTSMFENNIIWFNSIK